MRIAVAVAVAGAVAAWAAPALSQDDYRSLLVSCVLHYRCDTDACRATTPCDGDGLSRPDREFFETRAAEVAHARETPSQIADELVASGRPEGIGRDGGYVGRGRRVGCPPQGCAVAQPRSVPQTALPAQRIGRE